MNTPDLSGKRRLHGLPGLIFASRWLQLPLYLGLILAQAVYVYHFWVELVHLVEAAFGSQTALQQLVTSIGYKAQAIKDAAGNVTGYEPIKQLNETIIMLVVLALIDVVKVKLATAIIGISSIHLLKTFINAANYEEKVLLWQTVIHVAFLFSALAIAYADKLMSGHSSKAQH